jgi:cell division protein FtsW
MDTGTLPVAEPARRTDALPPVVTLPRPRRMFTARIALPPLSSVVAPDAALLAAVTLFLAGFGLLMVLSSSSVEAGQVSGDPFADFLRQGAATIVGIPLMLAAGRAPRTMWLRLGPWALAATVALQVLTALTPIGTRVGGNQNWIRIGSFSVQPSELVKVALILTVAGFFTRRPARTLGAKGLVPVLLLGAVAIGAVALGQDMGTCMILAGILLAGLVFADVRMGAIIGLFVLASPIAVVFVLLTGSRVARVTAWVQGCAGQQLDSCWQSQQGTWALAAGGILGKGLGNSVSKWFWLPEADNDFILAVIGEETGLVGLTLLLGLFVALTVGFLRVSTATRDPFARVATGMTLAWIVGQALINMAVVLGFLPVLGVPLPFISSGGSSMVANLLAVGCVMSLARRPAP